MTYSNVVSVFASSNATPDFLAAFGPGFTVRAGGPGGQGTSGPMDLATYRPRNQETNHDLEPLPFTTIEENLDWATEQLERAGLIGSSHGPQAVEKPRKFSWPRVRYWISLFLR